MKINRYLLTVVILTLLFFAPFLIKPRILTLKDNDLGRTYIPMLQFAKDSIIQDKTIPLWRPDQMMGEPLIGNAIFPVIYPLNLILIFLPANFTAVLFYAVHFTLAGVTTYFLAKSFGIKDLSALTAAVFYAFSTKMMVQTAAGHITMVAAFSFFPLAFLSVRKILQKPSYIWMVTGSISLAFLLILYPTIFYYSLLFLILYSLYYLWIHFTKWNYTVKQLLALASTFLIGLVLSAIQLIPQLEFGFLSTRSELKLEDVAVPLWNSQKLLSSLVFPYQNWKNLDHEAFLYLGFIPSILAILGFVHISKLRKIILLAFGVLTLLFIVGLSTPLFPLAYNFLPYLKYSRVTTRLWFIVALLVALLAAHALNKIKNKLIIYTFIVFFLLESVFIGYKKILDTPNLSFSNRSIYQFLANDDDIFRVYCTTYCFNPQLISRHKIEVLHGETPIQDEKFVDFLQKAGNYQFDRFAVIFPPYQVWQTGNPSVPDPGLLGLANVKYVASTYEINSEEFIFITKFDEIYLYKNTLFQPRALIENSQPEVTIEKYSPNKIVLSFEKTKKPTNLLLSEKFYPGWIATTGQQKLKIDSRDSIFRTVRVPAQKTNIELSYSPESYRLGKNITLATILFLFLCVWYTRKQKLNV
ncbi:hypothetical protein A3G14_04195 [Candidatus Curtissbacteria bacterium RIFCSPLOWO2_12_FULL_38_9]|uniref:Membrane protein 6-pyruvoyl-tetrahydropterin synthase-related domain-containing protein n=1 Tax=Candidatus Curtissbacteria bacterium RIFCSPLOWO2_12_FULL_38_9 TaxID=1797735 RepID=A0A1F5IAQ4_9BACT|nr:MAG: hypothetical protein A3G14_04195 [Candidatus Curtissbacteria bacterium RIFCSPLOWO2_12_FULL_38_9]